MTTKPEKISPQTYKNNYAQDKQSHHLIDVRDEAEYALEHIANAHHLALDALPTSTKTLPKDKPIIIYCRTGRRSAMAQQILAEQGLQHTYDLGGIEDWKKAGFPTESA
ncbi:MAG: rhodanese-like domain-containing protein [Chloroflexota bacterium]